MSATLGVMCFVPNSFPDDFCCDTFCGAGVGGLEDLVVLVAVDAFRLESLLGCCLVMDSELISWLCGPLLSGSSKSIPKVFWTWLADP